MEYLPHIAWFALGTFFGVVCSFAYINWADAQSMEELCRDIEDD